MSVSPKYRTNFSVNGILSPLDETQLLKSATASEYLLHEFRNSENNNSKFGGSAMSAVPVSTPFGVHVPQLGMSVGHHHPSHPHGHSASGSAFSSGSQYVNGASELSSAYGVADVRAPPAPWYSSSSADPRFASDYTLSTGTYKLVFSPVSKCSKIQISNCNDPRQNMISIRQDRFNVKLLQSNI